MMKLSRCLICVCLTMMLGCITQTAAGQNTYAGRPNYGALKFSQSSAYYSYLMLDLQKANALRDKELSEAFVSKKKMLHYISQVRDRLT